MQPSSNDIFHFISATQNIISRLHWSYKAPNQIQNYAAKFAIFQNQITLTNSKECLTSLQLQNDNITHACRITETILVVI